MIARLLIAAFLAPALGPAPAPAAAQAEASVFTGGKNMLANGGFENGLDGWIVPEGLSLVEDPKAARSGIKCVVGRPTRENQAIGATCEIAVKRNYLYTLECWVRAAQGAKMTAFVIQPGKPASQKASIGMLKTVPARWTRLEAAFTAEADGTLQVQLNVPSTFGAPIGAMWLDDVHIAEYAIADPVGVSKGEGFNDWPAMAQTADGSFYTAWISHGGNAESLRLARHAAAGTTLALQAEWTIAAGRETYVYGPRLIAAGPSRACLLYAAETSGNWDIHAVFCGPNGPEEPIRLTSDPAVDTDPAAAWLDGQLWVAWETNRGPESRRRIAAAAFSQDGRIVCPPAILSEDAACAYDPSIAITSEGRIAAAWHSFAQNNFDIYMREVNSQGPAGPIRRLTQAATIDRHAELFARGEELWIAYENATQASYSLGNAASKKIIVARIGADGLETPISATPNPLAHGGAEAAAPVCDSAGRIWIAALRGVNRSWTLLLAGFDGKAWTDAQPLTTLSSFDRRPSIAVSGDIAYVALQADNMATVKFDTVEASAAGQSDIYLAARDLGPASGDTAMAFESLQENTEPYAPAELRMAYGEDLPARSIEYNGKTLYLYYGNLHDHTEVSICNRIRDESIDEAYQDMRTINGLDFACVTDHGYNMTAYLWAHTAKLARINNDPGRFLTFLGEEWTSSIEEYSEKYPYGFYGHRNLIFEDDYFPKWYNARDRKTPAEIWADLRSINASFVQIPHQLADTGNVPVDWDYADEQAQPVAEVFQGRGSYEYLGAPRMAKNNTPTKGNYIQDAWEKGLVIGVIASPDHGGGRGKACVYAEDLSRKAILDAIRRRHTFGTSAARMFIDARVNGALMGEKIAAPNGKPVEIGVHVICPGEIDRIEVCRNNQFIFTREIEGTQASLTFIDENPLQGKSYYYVRVMQEDEELGWTSPVWLGY